MQTLQETSGRLFGRLPRSLVGRGLPKKQKSEVTSHSQREAAWRHHWNTRSPRPYPENLDQQWLFADKITVHTQPYSPFFQELLPELRHAIYELVLGGKTISLELRDSPKYKTFAVYQRCPQWTIALPKTCRLAYVESIGLVYRLNTFRITSVPPMLFLSSFVAPRLFNSIRSLDLEFDLGNREIPVPPRRLPPDDEATWERLWGTISAMQGVEVLKVSLLGHTNMDPGVEDKVLGPMACCKVQEYLVRVTWENGREGEVTEWPVTIEYPNLYLEDYGFFWSV